jgi:hypothetical protein
LSRILIYLSLPSFGCRGTKGRISLTENVPTNQKRCQALSDVISAAKPFAALVQLPDGAPDPNFRLGQYTNFLQHREQGGY